jgi:L-asparaginase II
MDLPAHVPLAVTTRGDRIESVHYGSIAVTDGNGRLLYGAGDPAACVFTRSTLKPFQALALLSHPGQARIGLSTSEIALICGSHSGEPRHTEAVSRLLDRIGCGPADLRCGVHPPLYYEAVGRHPNASDVFTPLHHNCSGKHAGMLALARLLDAPTEGYLDPEHPVQQAIATAVRSFLEPRPELVGMGIDGCSAPNFAIPLASLARGYARLAARVPDPNYGLAPRRIWEAMTGHPEMVAGTGRFDVKVMKAARGQCLCKSGAEGTLGLAIEGRGIAIKIADGAGRAVHVVGLEVLRQLGLLADWRDEALAEDIVTPIRSGRGAIVGEVRPRFALIRWSE